MDRLTADRMLVAVVETGSFAAAATRLGVSSGQASKLIARLECDLGTQLLTRSTRRLSTTEIGQVYVDRVRDLLLELDVLDDVVRNRTGEPRGRLRLSAPASFGVSKLTPALLDLSARHGGLELDVSFSDRIVNIADEGFDAAIRIGALADQVIIARKLTEARIVVCASPAYLEAYGRPQSPADLADHACIIDTNFRDPLKWRFAQVGAATTVAVNGRIRLSSAEACLFAAELGLGIARIPTFMAGERLRSGRLVPLLAAFEDAPLPVHVIYPPTRHLGLKVRVLVDFLVQHFAGRPKWDEGWE